MKINLGFVAICALSVSACVTPAQTFQYDSTRQVNAPYDEVWERTISVLASNNLPIRTLEKDSGIVVAENELVTVASMGEAASCPSSFLATATGGAMNYNILVRRVGDTSSSVTINTRYQMSYRDMNGASVNEICNSNGNVERMLLNAISGRID